ncbi:serine/threonine protein kinase [Natronoflexus pectinivorans]|uniref:Serine/threonine protein kinase n=1 Tax=Natronoflexus pectinivorans TaxID=682526 RepID=A0A4R2GH88_9BACT|nr:protein kinase [Natronoflexus pectinivorans]TCO07412.1 serine/threonine protein kinase [Natronoflexus pectinivorans]
MGEINDQIKKLNFQPLKLLSTGKFGEVWKAKDICTEQIVVIKPIRKQINQSIYKTLNTIEHPSLSTKSRVEQIEDQHFIIREFLEGKTLKELIFKPWSRKKHTRRFWLKAFSHLLGGLEKLHQNNILHLDIKPSNLIVNSLNGEPAPESIKLVDFEQAAIYPIEDKWLRRPFALGYSPPEQLLNINQLASPATDIFALGVTLYETLTQKNGFYYHDPEMMMHLQLNVPLLRTTKLPATLYTILSKATARVAFHLPPSRLSQNQAEEIIQQGIQKRYTSAEAFKNAIDEYLDKNNDHRTNWFEKLFNKLKQKH